MQLETKRFGTLRVEDDRLFFFPRGIVGYESLKQWVLLADPESPAVAWLQSASSSDHAVAVVSPRAFFPEYRVAAEGRELSALKLRTDDRVYVLTTLAGHVGRLETNLRAPILLNLSRRLGLQVIVGDEQPIRQALPATYHSRQLRAAA
jgi:flagellar assembly factor FliW